MASTDALIAAVMAGIPPSVAVTHSLHGSLDGISFFFVGPSGNTAAAFFGLTDKLETGNIDPLVSDAIAKASEVA